MRSFPPYLGILRSRTGKRTKRPLSKLVAQVLQEHFYSHLLGHGVDGVAVHPGRAGATVACDPFPRNL